MKTAIGEHIEKINALMNSNSKDGNAINICHFGNQELGSFCYGDLSKAENRRQIIEVAQDKRNSKLQEVIVQRSTLFDTNNQVKHWRVNELEFIDKWKANLEKLLSMLHTTHSILISNVQKMRRHLNIALDAEVNNKRTLCSRKKNAKKAKKEKERKLISKADEVLKLITNGKVSTYKQQQQSKEKIMAADFKECSLKQKFHSNALKFLLGQNAFDKDGEDMVSQMLDKLEASARKSQIQRQKQKYCHPINRNKSQCF